MLKEQFYLSPDTLNLIPYGIAILDDQRRYVGWNPALEDLTGIHARDLLGRSGEDIHSSSDWNRLVSVYQHFEKRYNGSITLANFPDAGRSGKSLSTTFHVLRDSESAIQGLIGLVCPLALEKDDGLISAHHQLQLLAEFATDYALVTLDASGCFSTWNRGAQRLFGYSADEIIGQSYDWLFVEEEVRLRQEPGCYLTAAREQGQAEFNVQCRCKDGSLPWVHVVIKAVRDQSDVVSGFIIVTRNPSEQSGLLEEIEDQKRRLRSIVETAIDAIVIIDEHGTIESFNPAGERLFGYQAEEVIGRNVKILMPEPFSAEHDGYLQRYLQSSQARIIGIGREVLALRKDGSIFPVDLAVSEFRDGKRLFTGIVRDITVRKRLEAEVLHIAEEEQQRLGQELHDDTQQQLTGLTMIAQHATDALARYLEQEPRLVDVHARFQSVVKGLRDANQSLHRLARGLIPLQIRAHGLRDALANHARQLTTTHTIHCHFEAGDGVVLDNSHLETHLYRIAQEATTNIVKHAQATEITIRLRSAEGTIFLEIEDNGIGIDDQTQSLGRGLQIMSYRAGLIGATFSVRRLESGGTRVTCSLRQP